MPANVCRFDSTRGPEIELCFGDEGTDPATENDWSLLPFMALSDGAHMYDPHPDLTFTPAQLSLLLTRYWARSGRRKSSPTSLSDAKRPPPNLRPLSSALRAPDRSTRTPSSTAPRMLPDRQYRRQWLW